MLENNSPLVRHKTEIAIFLFLVFSLTTRYLFVMPDMDEIWNYQYARRILYGYLPYRDFFMLQTPLSAQINASLLFLFGDELIVLKFMGLLIASIQGLVHFLILRKIGNNELKSFIFICVIVCLVFLYPHINYSWLVILFLSLALYLELLKIQSLNNKKFIFLELLIGIILGLATITKQNIGIAGVSASIALTLYYYLSLKTYDLKVYFSGLFIKIFGWIVIVGIELLYFWQNDSIIFFYEQTILNPIIFAKGSAMPYYKLLSDYSIVYAVLALLIPLIMFLMFCKYLLTKRNQMKNMLLTILIYSMVNFLMVFPLSDPVHLILSIPITVVGLSLLFNKETNNHIYKLKPVKYYSFIFLTMISFILLGLLMNINNRYVLNVNHYRNIHATKSIALKLYEIDYYLLSEKQIGKQIYFLDYRSSFYLIPLDIFNYKSDDMLRSEFGLNGEKEMIQKFSSSNDTVVLIRNKDTIPNRQDSGVFYDYVRSNMNYITSIQEFDVYIN